MQPHGLRLFAGLVLTATFAGSVARAEKIYWADRDDSRIQRSNLDGTNVETVLSAGLIFPRGLALDVVAGKLYFTDEGTKKIQRANLDGTSVEDILGATTGEPWGVAIDFAGGKLYWADAGTRKISRCNLDGTNVEHIFEATVDETHGMAIDAAAEKMYWTDRLQKNVRRANLDGTSLETLVTGLGNPRGIALDVAGGKMYWADNSNQRIQRANLDGTSVETIVPTPTAGSPVGVALNLAAGKVYWTDPSGLAIRRANLDGTSVETVFSEVSRPTPGPEGIFIDSAAGKMYWCDHALHTVRRANLDGTALENLNPVGTGNAKGIAVDLVGGDIYWSEVDVNNGGKLRVSDLNGIGAVDLVTTEVVLPVDLAVDSASGKLYWSDSYTLKLQRANFDGTVVEDLFVNQGGIRGIALDLLNSKLYWTNIGNGQIIRGNLDGTGRQVLISTGLDGPNSVEVDALGGVMYWTDPFAFKIQRANLDGTNIVDLITSGLGNHKGITLDLSAGKMYWADRGLGTIARANLDGTSVQAIVTGLARPETTALELISFSQQPASAALCETDPLSLTVTAVGAPPLGYQWRKNGADIPGANADSYSIPSVTVADTGEYDVVVTNANSQAISQDAVVVVAVQPAVDVHPQTQTACELEAVTLSVTASGAALNYQWRVDNVDIPGATGDTLVLDPVSLADAGDYDVVVTNICGTATSSVAVLTIDELPAVTANPQPLVVCDGEPATFNVSATGVPPLSYQWRKNGVDIPGATGASLMFNPAAPADAGDYDAVVTNSCGQTISAVASLAVEEAASIATPPGSQIVCETDDATFTVTPAGTPPFSYQWRKGGVDIPGETGETLLISAADPDDAGSYDVVVTNNCGQATSTAATLGVDEPAVIETQPASQTVCEAQSVSFSVSATGTAPITYQWRKNGADIAGETGASLAIDPVLDTDSGSYDVVVSNGCDTVISAAAGLDVEIAPFVVTQPVDQSGCPGDLVTFSVTGDGTAPLAYQWRRNGAIIPGATGSMLSVFIHDGLLRGADTFDVVITNGCGEVSSVPVTLTVGEGPAITTQPASQSVCDEGSLTLTVAASGSAPFTYQWRKQGVDVPGATGDSLMINPVSVADAGDYDVVVTNGCGQAISAAATITVETGPILTLQPVSQSACEGTLVSLSVAATGTAPVTYQWRRNGIDIPGATGAALNIDPVLLTDAGDYDVVVTDACGQDISVLATVTVEAGPSITTQPQPQSVCDGGSATLTVVAGGEPPLTYQWRKNGIDIPGATSDSLTFNPAAPGDAGDYDVVVSNACAQLTSVAATLAVGQGPMINTQPASDAVCDGGSATFSVGVAGSATYQWRKNGIDVGGATNDSLTINPVTTGDAGNYDVVVTNGCGQTTSAVATLSINQGPAISTQPQSQAECSGGSVTLTVAAGGTEPLNYQWRKGGADVPGATGASLLLDPVMAADAGDYDVVVTNGCGQTISDVATVTVNASPSISTQPASQSVCDGGAAALSVVAEGTAPLSYQWRLGGVDLPGETADSLSIDPAAVADAGDYDVVITNGCGQTTSAIVTLSVGEGPGITAHPQSQAICDGGSVTLSVSSSGTSPLSYQWRKGGIDIPGETGPDLTIDPVSFGDAGDYDVVVTNACGQSTSTIATLTVQAGPAISGQPASQIVCENSPVAFSVIASGTAPITYQWRRNGADIIGATTDSLAILSATPADAGSYDVVVTTGCGAITSAVAALTVNVSPAITVQPQPQAVCVEGQAVFSVSATGTGPLSYQWRQDGVDIPGATQSALVIVVVDNSLRAVYGTFDVVVTNECGSTISAGATLSIDEAPMITAHPEGTNACEDGSVSLSVTATGSVSMSYQWRRNGVDVPGATGSTLLLDPVTTAQAGNYDVVVMNGCGQVNSAVATLVVGTGPAITAPPNNVEICEGSLAIFTVGATGTGTLQYDWFVDGLRVGVNSQMLELSGVTLEQDGTSIVCEVIDDCGTITSTPATLLVGPAQANFDCDADVDLQDFATFSQCYNGSAVPPAPSCPPGADADLDDDGDVDLADFARLASVFTGAR